MTTEESTKVAVQVSNVLEAIKPFIADDGHKGTFLVMRIAGLEQTTALRIIKRKYRSIQNWRSVDPDFKRVDDAIPVLMQRFGGEARVMRTALLDISIIEAGVSVFRRILSSQPVSDSMWAYATKLAGLRVPMMGAKVEGGSPWENLANAIKTTIVQKELVVREEPDGSRSVMAKETVIEPSAEQRQIASDIVQRMIEQAGGNG